MATTKTPTKAPSKTVTPFQKAKNQNKKPAAVKPVKAEPKPKATAAKPTAKPAAKTAAPAKAKTTAASKPKAETKVTASVTPSLAPASNGAVLAGPISVPADALLLALRQARQGCQKHSKSGDAPVCVHVEFHGGRNGDELLQIIGYSNELLLRTVVDANVTPPRPERFPDEPPVYTALIHPKKKKFINFVADCAADPGNTIVRIYVRRKVQDGTLGSGEWFTELVAETDHAAMVEELHGVDPGKWRALEPFASLPTEGLTEFIEPAGVVNRIGAVAKVARWHRRFVGPDRPFQLRGTYQGEDMVIGWVMPSEIKATDLDGAASEAAEFVRLLNPAVEQPPADPDATTTLDLGDDEDTGDDGGPDNWMN